MKNQVILIGAGEGNRTLVVSLGSFCSTIELHPRSSHSTRVCPVLANFENGRCDEMGWPLRPRRDDMTSTYLNEAATKNIAQTKEI
jgi:hypothetical protein